MGGSVEINDCSICGKKGVVGINRKYFHYNIKCDCHSPMHFEMIYHCNDCIPIPPKKTVVYIKPID